MFQRVTTVLMDAGLIDVDAPWYTEAARDFGKKLHLATQCIDEGGVDWDDLDPRLVPRARQYQRFLKEVKPEVLAIEEKVENPPFLYQGTLDRRARINGDEGIYDIKPPSKARWHGVQLAMYAHCFARPMRRWVLHLHDDRYQFIEQKNRNDWNVAKACLVLAAWKGEE